MVAVGTNSCSSSNRFGPTSTFKLVTPVRLPPGRFTLVTSPTSTGSTAIAKTIGIVAVAAFAASAEGVPPAATITVTCRRTRSAARVASSIVSGFRPTIFDLNVLALDVTYLFQALPKRAQTVRVRVRRCAAKETDHRSRLLRACSKRPRGRGANNHFDEFAPSHCLPRGSRQGIVSAQTSTLEGGGHALRGRTADVRFRSQADMCSAHSRCPL